MPLVYRTHFDVIRGRKKIVYAQLKYAVTDLRVRLDRLTFCSPSPIASRCFSGLTVIVSLGWRITFSVVMFLSKHNHPEFYGLTTNRSNQTTFDGVTNTNKTKQNVLIRTMVLRLIKTKSMKCKQRISSAYPTCFSPILVKRKRTTSERMGFLCSIASWWHRFKYSSKFLVFLSINWLGFNFS